MYSIYVQGGPYFREQPTKTTAVSLLALFDGLQANIIVVQGYCGLLKNCVGHISGGSGGAETARNEHTVPVLCHFFDIKEFSICKRNFSKHPESLAGTIAAKIGKTTAAACNFTPFLACLTIS